ncbi:MAG: hypothetical protein ACXQTD_01880, partial [Candidatus Syntropharchaeia archaeon]
MRGNVLAGLMALIVLVSVVMFSWCIEEDTSEATPTATPTPTYTPTVTPTIIQTTPTATPAVTPTPFQIQPSQVSYESITRSYSWTYAGREWTWTLYLPKSLY